MRFWEHVKDSKKMYIRKWHVNKNIQNKTASYHIYIYIYIFSFCLNYIYIYICIYIYIFVYSRGSRQSAYPLFSEKSTGHYHDHGRRHAESRHCYVCVCVWMRKLEKSILVCLCISWQWFIWMVLALASALMCTWSLGVCGCGYIKDVLRFLFLKW